MLKEFKEFAMRGSVVDLAVGVIIGAAFGAIVKSLVDDILMPPIGLLIGGIDFSNLFVNLSGQEYPSLAAAKEAGAATINYGVFLNNVLHFAIVAFAVFLLVKQVNRLKGPVIIDARDCPFCLSKMAIKATRCPACTSEVKAA